MKKLFLVFISAIIGLNAMFLAMWLDWSDNACIVTMAMVSFGVAYALGFFNDDEDVPYSKHKRAHDHDKAAA